MTDSYNRLVTFVIDICPKPQRELLVTLAGQAFQTNGQTFKIGSFLLSRKPFIEQLLRWKKIRPDQYNTICDTFNKSYLYDWDVSLLSVILKELFRVELKQEEHDALAEIRMVRNELQHKSSTANISEQAFRESWTSLEDATLFLARNAYRDTSTGQGFQNLIQIEINTIKTNPMPNITACLTSWNAEIKKEMIQLKAQIGLVGVDSRFSRDVLTSLTVKQTARSGIPMKRMRTLDPRIEKLKDNFKASFEQFSNKPIPVCEDTEKIARHLRTHHWVLISSYDSKKAYMYALCAVKELAYTKEYSLEVAEPSDWSHIGFEDAELVVFKHPFGKDSYDSSKASAMVNAMDNIMQTVEAGKGHGQIDVIIMSDSKLLEECRRNHGHDMLDRAITVCPGTTEKEPIDLTYGHNRTLCTETSDSVYRNMLDMSQCYLRQHNLEYKNRQLMQMAKMKFKGNKVLFICGPRGSGKTTLAVSLLRAYQIENVILLTEPDELKHIYCSETLAILIENLAGYTKIDESEANKWFRKFDLLNAAAMDCCLKIIVTMQQGIFDEWSKLMPKHPILDNIIQLSQACFVKPKIKQEKLDADDVMDTQMLSKNVLCTGSSSPIQLVSRTATASNRHVCSVDSDNAYPIQHSSDRFQCMVSGICTLPSGDLLLTDELNKNLRKLDRRYNVVDVLTLPSMPLGTCYVGNNVAVASTISTLQFIDISGKLTRTTSVDTDHSCFSITCHDEKLYVAGLAKVHVYNTSGLYERVIDIGSSNPISGLAVSGDGKTIYVTKRMAITKFEWSGLVTMDTKGTILSSLQLNSYGVCVDSNGNVLVLCANGVVQVSADGKCILDLLIDDDTLGESICFDEKSSSLIASHSVGNSITVFKLTEGGGVLMTVG